MDGSVPEGLAPGNHGRVVMGVRDGNFSNAAQLVEPFDRHVIEKRDAVPQDVAALGLYQESTLADPELRLGVDRVQSRLFFFDDVLVPGSQGFQSRPFLAISADVLPFVLADGAAFRRLVGPRILSAAGDTNECRRFPGIPRAGRA